MVGLSYQRQPSCKYNANFLSHQNIPPLTVSSGITKTEATVRQSAAASTILFYRFDSITWKASSLDVNPISDIR